MIELLDFLVLAATSCRERCETEYIYAREREREVKGTNEWRNFKVHIFCSTFLLLGNQKKQFFASNLLNSLVNLGQIKKVEKTVHLQLKIRFS